MKKNNWIDTLSEGFNKQLIRAEEERAERKWRHQRNKMVFVMTIFVVLIIVLVLLATGCSNKVNAETTATTSAPAPAPVSTFKAKEFTPIREGNIRMTIVSTDGPVHLRYNPDLSDAEKTSVDLANGTQFYVDTLYHDGQFYGFRGDAYHQEFLGDLLEADADGIFWLYTYYVDCDAWGYLPENAPEVKNLEIMDVEDPNIIGFEVHGNPRVRSTPTTTTDGNIYGRISDARIVVGEWETIKTDGHRAFFGVSAAYVEAYLYDESYGHIYYDADGILWISAEYADPIYK